MKNIQISVEDIVDFVKDEVISIYGNYKNLFVNNISSTDNANENSLDWINNSKKNKQTIAESSQAKVLLVDNEVVYSGKLKQIGKVFIVVEKPRMVLSKIITEFWIEKKTSFIHETAIIDKNANIDKTAYIEAGCVIGKVSIGKNTVIKSNVTISDSVIIGDNCIIQSGTVLGTDGLGCDRLEDGTLVKFPHIGKVFIGNNVEIGANCQVAKGALSDTIISDGCKINGLCFIAHNCFLGKNVWITGSTMLSGSVYVEDNVTIYSSVIIRDQLRIGKGAVIGMGSVVVKHIPEGETWLGCPAKKQNND